MDLSAADAVIEAAIRDGAMPGACYAINDRVRAAGSTTYNGEPVSTDTLWDLASLTKVVCTTSLAAMLYEEGALDLDAPVRKVLPAFRHESITFRHLLLHNSGLPASHPCPSRIREASELLRDVFSIALAYPTGSDTIYSDLGFIVLGKAIEAIADQPLDELFHRRISSPLGLGDTGFTPNLEIGARSAPTEAVEPWRVRLRSERGVLTLDRTWIRGEVHDPTAMVLGGVAGHAGLFSTITDLSRFTRSLSAGELVRRDTLDLFTRRASKGSSRTLGWDTPSPGSSAGTRFGARAFGHTGFTGTSIWVDPDRGLTAILLTNRVHPTAQNEKIKAVRIAFHDAIPQP